MLKYFRIILYQKSFSIDNYIQSYEYLNLNNLSVGKVMVDKWVIQKENSVSCLDWRLWPKRWRTLFSSNYVLEPGFAFCFLFIYLFGAKIHFHHVWFTKHLAYGDENSTKAASAVSSKGNSTGKDILPAFIQMAGHSDHKSGRSKNWSGEQY